MLNWGQLQSSLRVFTGITQYVEACCGWYLNVSERVNIMNVSVVINAVWAHWPLTGAAVNNATFVRWAEGDLRQLCSTSYMATRMSIIRYPALNKHIIKFVSVTGKGNGKVSSYQIELHGQWGFISMRQWLMILSLQFLSLPWTQMVILLSKKICLVCES